jgi:hypothetical protein
MSAAERLAVSRRDFLQQMGCGLGSVALASLGVGAARAAAVEIDPVRPVAPRRPRFAPKAESVIFLYMVGGPSSIDLFDYKPELQKLHGKPVPESIAKRVKESKYGNIFASCKDELLASPWKWKQYGQSGMRVSDLYPGVAQHVDDLCFVHSMQAESNNHGPASIQLHTGDVNGGKASIGSWVTYGLGTANQNLPAYVLLFEAGPLGGATNYSNGFLPAAFQGTRLRDTSPPVRDLLPPDAFAAGQRQTLDVLQKLNLLHRQPRPGFTDLDARIASYELAYRMQSAALEVADLEKEPAWLQEKYGINHSNIQAAKFGRKCLMARRLVEKGVRFVQLYDMFEKDGWDAHDKLKENHEIHAAVSDRGVAALLEDLKQRGLLDTTLVIWASEFGRTPMVQGNVGRQHNYAGFTLWMAGGGTKAGLRYGATDELGMMVTEKPVSFRDLHATILTALGIDYEALSYSVNGRMERLTGVQNTAKVISDLLV